MMDCSWLQGYSSNADEYLLFGYINRVLVRDIWISNHNHWESMLFEMSALSYWNKISTSYAGYQGYNLSFNNSTLKKKEIQKFLAKLIEFELDYYVTFNVHSNWNSHDDGNEDLMYTYDFGDNTQLLKSSKSTVQHQYIKPGVYVVTVTISDKDGVNKACARLTQRIIDSLGYEDNKENDEAKHSIDEPYCSLSYTMEDDGMITFDASKSVNINGGKCTKFMFDFGDGSEQKISSTSTIKYKYGEPGIYLVKVEAFDEQNDCSSSAECTISIDVGLSLVIESSPTNCQPKADVKWIKNEKHRYIQQLFHHMLISQTGRKNSGGLNDLEIDFRNIQKESMIGELRTLILENPNDPAESWRISRDTIKRLYPNTGCFANENGEIIIINEISDAIAIAQTEGK